MKTFKRSFTDNSHYKEYKMKYMDSLAFMVQEILYSEKAGRNHRIAYDFPLYDFMNLLLYVIWSSLIELGKTDINRYLSYLQESLSPLDANNHVSYIDKEHFIVNNATPWLINDLLWTAYVYIEAMCRLKLIKGDNWYCARDLLYNLLKENIGLSENNFKTHVLIKLTDEAVEMIRGHIRKHLSQKQQPMPQTSNKEKSSEGDVSKQQTRIAALEAENAKLKAENEQLKHESPVCEADEKSMPEFERLKKLHEDMLVELLKPAFFGMGDDASDFLRKIEGLDNQGVADVARQFLKDSKIVPSKKGRPIWLCLHAAKLYSATEQNWTAAMRKDL